MTGISRHHHFAHAVDAPHQVDTAELSDSDLDGIAGGVAHTAHVVPAHDASAAGTHLAHSD